MDPHVVAHATDGRGWALPAVLAWLDRPRADKGVRFARDGDEWSFQSYAQLAAASYRVASALASVGVNPNDVVAVALHSGPEFVSTFFGTLLAGAVPAACAPVARFQQRASYELYAGGVLRAVRPYIVVAESASVSAIAADSSTPLVMTFEELLGRGGLTAAPRPASRAVLQLTSGSTGSQRAVRVSLQALQNNVGAIHQWLRWSADETFVSWLPLYHDMGLVGALIAATVAQSDLWLLRPEHFVRDPSRYLRCFDAGGGSLSAIASWGIEYIARRTSPQALVNLDLSGWKGLVVGAERIDASALRELHALLQPFGFRRGALLPAYGMAEASLAITGVPLGTEWTSIRTASDGEIVGCGWPLRDIAIELVGEDGQPMRELGLGEIVVRSTSLASDYADSNDALSDTRLDRDTLHTGDAGVLADGQLFPVGRFGDSIKIRGRVLFAEDVELSAIRHGVPRSRVAALLGTHHGTPTVVVVIERMQRWPVLLESQIRQLAAGAAVVLIGAPAGTLLRTSSGKPRRRALWHAFLEGRLAHLSEWKGP